jgi:hypothetical protein
MVKRYVQIVALTLLLNLCLTQFACIGNVAQPGSNCSACADGIRCTTCDADYYVNANVVGNVCRAKSSLLAKEGLDKSVTPPIVGFCKDPNCTNCSDNTAECVSCSSETSYLEYTNKNCTLMAPTAADGVEVFPVYKTTSTAMKFSDDKSALEIFFFEKVTKNENPRLVFGEPVMGDDRPCRYCQETAAYKIDSRLAATEGEAFPIYDKYTAYLGFTKAFPVKQFTMRFFRDTSETATTFQSKVPGAVEDLKIIDTFYKTHTSEVISWWLKIWNFCTMTGLMIIFPMSSYFINQMFSFFGYVRVLSGPAATATGVVMHYLTSDYIWPFYVPNPYTTTTMVDLGCTLLPHHVQNALTCNIIGNFGHIFNKMAAALVINLIVFGIFQAWRRRTEEADLKTNWFLVRIRKYWGLRYFYQFMDAYNYELLGYIFLNFSRVTTGANITGLVLSIILFIYYIVFYALALLWILKVESEAASRSSAVSAHSHPEYMDELRSLYDSDFAFLLERYKPRQNLKFGHLMPFIWFCKNLLVQIFIICLEKYGTAQLSVVLSFELLWAIAVVLVWGKKYLHDNLYDACFCLFHVVFLILKLTSQTRGFARDYMEGTFGIALATFLLLIGLITIIHSVLVIIGDLLYLSYGESRTRAMRRGNKGGKDTDEKASLYTSGKVAPQVESKPYRR